ncbi:MAG TPA: carboxylesterase/lipase family protein [Hyphomonadaceae bacterium]|nr:carboxylesterase/lipase family protein [Hyphomonadaceae bacterium]
MISRILAGLAAVVLASAPIASAQTVKTKPGEVSGVTANGVASWKGIPFAQPPVGELRWQPPQPTKPWKTALKADTVGAACPQPERGDGGGVGAPPKQSEDCLTLNVFAPAGAKNLPVMVWIHGGAFRLGYSGAPLYDGAEFAKQGVVLVTVNYRLGLLGFFAHPTLTAAAKPGEPLGNYGLMDQLAALHWVQDNIAAFGGDPKNVTAFGESAGGSSMIYLLANPAAKGLFAKAIVESGGGLQRPGGLKDNEARGVQSAGNIGLGADAKLADLRAKPAEDWIKAQGALQGGLGFGPFIDGRLVTEAPWQAFKDGRAIDVPLIIGANSNESSVLTTLGVPTAALSAAVGPRMAEFRKLYGEGTSEEEFTRQAMGDIVFVAPSRWIAAQASSGAPSWLYYFSYVAESRRSAVPGANHGSEIPYVFKTWTQTPVLARFMSDADKQMSETMSACWVSFAKTGKPSCLPAPSWPAYDPKIDQQMEFGATIKVETPPRAAAADLIVSQALNPAR